MSNEEVNMLGESRKDRQIKRVNVKKMKVNEGV